MLTARPKGEDFIWIAGVLHHPSVTGGEVVLAVVVHYPQQADGGAGKVARQEHRGGHGLRPPPHLHASTGGEHHRHIVRGRAKDENTWRGRGF